MAEWTHDGQADGEEYVFPHQRLVAHKVSQELLVLAREVSGKVPYGFRKFADLLRVGGRWNRQEAGVV